MINRLIDVFKSFQKYNVKYLVIGSIAAVLYGVPRATFDLDIIIEASEENARRLLEALLDAGLGTASLTNKEEILSNEITVFKERVRVYVQTKAPGLIFEEVWKRKQTMNYHGQEFYVASLEDLVASKKATGKAIDLEDVRLLELPDNKNKA